MSAPFLTAPVTELDDAESTGSFSLLVVTADGIDTLPLPPTGAVTIGRQESCHVRLDDPSASRTHARLHVGPPLAIEDLGSSNGTKVRGARAPAGVKLSISVGETVSIGATLLIVQPLAAVQHGLRLWSHVHLEARLADACAQAPGGEEGFLLLRAKYDHGVSKSQIMSCVGRLLRPSDAVALYAPKEYEVLLSRRPLAELLELSEKVKGVLRQRGEVRFGVAVYPKDGRSPDALLWRVAEGIRGAASARMPKAIVVSPVMKEIYDLAARAGGVASNILVLGETGVGKDVLARAIHQSSPRADRPFLALNCAGLNETLLESELFGHERGAFTGAVAAKRGLLEVCDGGTLFLDEVGEVPLGVQAKLLRVLDDQEVRRVGGLHAKKLDIHFVAATNRNLEHAVAAGSFRSDLYFRLAVMVIDVPPLRARQDEILPLAEHFLRDLSQYAKHARPPNLSPDAAAWLLAYSWPGNIRELKNVMERALVLCASNEIQLKHLPVEKLARAVPPPDTGPQSGGKPTAAREEKAEAVDDPASRDEKARILQALARCAGNQVRAAEVLGMSRRTLVRRLEAYGITRPRTLG